MELTGAVDAYDESTQLFLHDARRVHEDSLDRHVDGGWSSRQIIHHVADSETQSYIRLRRLLGEPPGTLIQGYDEGAWAQCERLGYRTLPVTNSLLVISAVRAASSNVLALLQLPDLERFGEHTGTGRYTLKQWLEIYTRHPREHAEQLNEAANA